MRSTTSARYPTFSSTDIKTAISRSRSIRGREWGCDVFPCPVDLFEYIADITMLYKLQSASGMKPDVVDRAVNLGLGVKVWTSPTAYSPLKTLVVNSWQQGIILYLVRLFRLESSSTFDLEALKNSIFANARVVPVASSWSFSMLWPLF
jgi:hypothetical protein